MFPVKQHSQQTGFLCVRQDPRYLKYHGHGSTLVSEANGLISESIKYQEAEVCTAADSHALIILSFVIGCLIYDLGQQFNL